VPGGGLQNFQKRSRTVRQFGHKRVSGPRSGGGRAKGSFLFIPGKRRHVSGQGGERRALKMEIQAAQKIFCFYKVYCRDRIVMLSLPGGRKVVSG